MYLKFDESVGIYTSTDLKQKFFSRFCDFLCCLGEERYRRMLTFGGNDWQDWNGKLLVSIRLSSFFLATSWRSSWRWPPGFRPVSPVHNLFTQLTVMQYIIRQRICMKRLLLWSPYCIRDFKVLYSFSFLNVFNFCEM